MSIEQELNAFLEQWQDGETRTREAFVRLRDFVAAKPGISFDFKGRPGVSYSLRAGHENQTGKSLFVLLDVIDDDPANRWLSVCFYNDFITDPDEQGDFVPEGLLGEDACCFDVDEYDEKVLGYVEARLAEGYAAAEKNL